MFKCCAAAYRSAKQPVALAYVLSLCVFIYIHLTKPNMQYGVCYSAVHERCRWGGDHIYHFNKRTCHELLRWMQNMAYGFWYRTQRTGTGTGTHQSSLARYTVYTRHQTLHINASVRARSVRRTFDDMIFMAHCPFVICIMFAKCGNVNRYDRCRRRRPCRSYTTTKRTKLILQYSRFTEHSLRTRYTIYLRVHCVLLICTNTHNVQKYKITAIAINSHMIASLLSIFTIISSMIHSQSVRLALFF